MVWIGLAGLHPASTKLLSFLFPACSEGFCRSASNIFIDTQSAEYLCSPITSLFAARVCKILCPNLRMEIIVPQSSLCFGLRLWQLKSVLFSIQMAFSRAELIWLKQSFHNRKGKWHKTAFKALPLYQLTKSNKAFPHTYRLLIRNWGLQLPAT